jgi:NADPH:quinone reductase-like Zn-dependent oxidoreductase
VETAADQYIVTFGGKPPPTVLGADYGARVYINSKTGKVDKRSSHGREGDRGAAREGRCEGVIGGSLREFLRLPAQWIRKKPAGGDPAHATG